MNEQTDPNVLGEPEFVHPQWALKESMIDRTDNQYWPRYGPTMYMFSQPLTERDQRALRELERATYLHGGRAAREHAYDEMVETQRNLLLEHGREQDWTRTQMDDLLLYLSMDPTEHRFDVEVRLGDSGVLLISGVEASNASLAQEVVEENIEIAARVRVDVSVAYEGPGVADEFEVDFEYDDNDELANSVVDEITNGMQITVTECDDKPW